MGHVATPSPSAEPLPNLAALARTQPESPPAENGWLPSGRLVELSGAPGRGRTTATVAFVIHAQLEGEVVAWVQPEGGALFPPDLAESGVDLDSLVVVHVPRTTVALAKAAELLLRSGAFGVVVIDLVGLTTKGAAWQSRLGGLAREHACRVVLLTDAAREAPSAGPLVMVRLEPVRERCGPGRFVLAHQVLKNKSPSPFQPVPQGRRAPPGLG